MNKVRKTVILPCKTVEAIQELAKKDSRSFSKMVEILLDRQLSDEVSASGSEKNSSNNKSSNNKSNI